MTPAPTRSFAPPAATGLTLPRWAFVAWDVYSRRLDAGPRVTLAASLADDVEARRRARLLRELVPQD